MLDVHILQHPEFRGWKVGRCLDSCMAERAHVHLLKGYDGHIGRGRVDGFSRGNQPFVTYVDDDDMLVPGTLDLLVGLLEKTPDAAMAYAPNTCVPEQAQLPPAQTTALTWRVSEAQKTHHALITDHMVVYRRDKIQALLPMYRRYRRGGDSRVLHAYRSRLKPTEKVVRVKEQNYLWCGG